MSISQPNKTSFPPDEQASESSVAMTKQQKRYGDGALSTYKEFSYGKGSWLGFASFELYSALVSNLPGLIGYGLRRIVLPSFFKSTGKSITIGRGVSLRQPGNISLGSNVIVDDYVTLDVRSTEGDGSERVGSEIVIGDHAFIGKNSIIAAKGGSISLGSACNISSSCRIATQSNISIGESALIAAYVYIGPGNHGVKEKDKPIIEQEMELRGGVAIGDFAWIGTRATIVDGVTIGKHAVIGAHSLVLEDVPDGAVVAGTPAKIIRHRD